MSEKQIKFQKLIKPLGNNINAYIRISDKSDVACIVLHEHLGLVQNIVQSSQFLIGDNISVVIPDLFLTVTAKTLLNNQFDAIKKLKFGKVVAAVEGCLKELQKSHNKFILMGFSIGSAYGFKILQKYPQIFKVAFLFYGVPNINKCNPNDIKTKVFSFYGTDDRIKYLSSYSTYQEFIKKCKNNKNIKFVQIVGGGHGFCNPQSQYFSDKAVAQCQEKFNLYIQEVLNIKNQKNGDKSNCNIF